jgi:hypothetical protein
MLRGEDQASRDNLGSRSSRRLRLPILRAKHDKRRPGMERLSGKTALVTGSTDGVGRLVALDKPSARLNSAGLGATLPYDRLTNGLRKRNEFGS